jgi:serine/threonine-protein kinase
MRVDHPNICKIHVVGERDEAFIMVMEHCDGGDLRERLVQPHPWREAVRVAREVAQGLAFAAREGIVHGNVRPSNVMFDRDGAIKVTDFGLPEHYAHDGSTQRNWYAAPEGGRSHAADLFSLGAVIYEMLFAAAPPESVDDALANLRRRVDLPQGFVRILARLLAPAPARFGSAEEVACEFSHLLQEDRRLQAECAAGPASPAPPPTAPARAVPRVASHGPALVGLSGLILAWLFQQRFFQSFLEAVFANW